MKNPSPALTRRPVDENSVLRVRLDIGKSYFYVLDRFYRYLVEQTTFSNNLRQQDLKFVMSRNP